MGTLLVAKGRLTEAQRPPSALSIHDASDGQTFDAMEPEWNALVEAGSAPPFCRHEFIRSFLANFAPKAGLRIVTGRDPSGNLAAALPLIITRGSMWGLSVRQLESPTNVHSLRFDFVADDETESAAAVFEHLSKDRSWDVLRICDVPEGGQAWKIYRAAQEARFPVGAWEAQRSPYITLPRSYAELADTLSAKFKANLRRRRKRLAEKGVIGIERVAGEALTEDLLEQCFVLERESWKGRQGSAANQSEAIRGFHFDLLRSAPYRDHLSLSLLRLDGAVIAFHYGLTLRGVYSLVMTSYDERFKEFSPGHLLTEDVLKDCISLGLSEFDFLGCDLAWKMDWATTVRPHHWLFIFRNTLKGRALRQIKFGWAKTARLLLTR